MPQVEKNTQIQESIISDHLRSSTLDFAPSLQEKTGIERMIIDHFPENYETMLKIANCESNIRQFYDNGEVVNSPTDDWGVMQINRPVWGEKAKELGYDIYSTTGNIKMARYIYDKQGVTAWSCYKLINK